MKKKYYLILDTETANSVEEPIPYDIGWVVCDRKGEIYERRSYVVAETFLYMKDVMNTAYYAEKIPNYWNDIKAGRRVLAKMWNIRKLMLDDLKKYEIKDVGAYNMSFDRTALNNLIRWHTKSKFRYWFPYDINYFCIWAAACDTILNRPTYIKFALDNGLVSEKTKNVSTSAENAYRYMLGNTEFIESHTGLEDVLIEVEIFAYCVRQHKKMNTTPSKLCWKKVQAKRKAIRIA